VTTGIPDADSARSASPRALSRVGPRLAIAAVAVIVAGGVAVMAMARSSSPANDQRVCVDVAHEVGLDFTGGYGPVFPAQNAYGTLMQENMGNGAAVGDIDGDGYLDVLLLGQAGQHSRLFHNDPAPDGGRHFTDITEAAGLGAVTSNARVAQFVDLAGTGRPDLVIAADYQPGGPGGPSQLFRNDGAGHFTDVTAGSGFDPSGYIVGGMAFADYDGSGRPSIWLSYWTNEGASDPGRTDIKGLFPGSNRLYRNLGDYRFEDVTESMGPQAYHGDSFTAVFADFTDDGKPDIYQANDNRPDRFYENLGGGTFRDPGYRSGLTRIGNSMGVATTVEANGGEAVPVSYGYHPYFRLPGVARADWIVELPERVELELDDRQLPTGEERVRPAERGPLGERIFDHLFRPLQPLARFALSGGGRRVVVEMGAGYPYAQVYAPSTLDVTCFEPMTAPVAALATGRDLTFVRPGERRAATFAVRVRNA